MICRKLCVCPGGTLLADDQGKKVGAEDAEDAADGRPDQALQADQTKSPFKEDDGDSDYCSDRRVALGSQAERLDLIASNRNK